MRMIGLIGLVLALVIVGMLAKKQLAVTGAPAAGGNARVQSQQIEQQVKKTLDAAQQREQKQLDDTN
jgi:hypothetical protein